MNSPLFEAIHGLSSNFLISNISMFLSYVLIYIIPVFLIIWIIFFRERKIYSFLIIAASSGLAWFVTEIVKNITAIKRPDIIEPVIVEQGCSFPSGHAAVTMALAIAVYSLNKKIGILFIIISILIGISRVILGVHFPVDVIGGWVLGFFIAFVLISLFKEL